MSSGLLCLDDLLEQRQQLGQRADLAVDDEDVGVLEHRLHALGVGDEVRADVALVELHALGELELEAGGLALLDRDDAVLADLVDRLGDELADQGVLGGDGGDRGDLVVGLHLGGGGEQRLVDGLDGRVDADLEAHRVGAGGDGAQALVDHGLAEHGRGGGAVTRDVVGLGGDLLGELRTHVLVAGPASSISRAMVTPSLVMVGPPYALASTTLRPFGPSVTLTALARASTPRSSERRASSEKLSVLAMRVLSERRRPGPRVGSGASYGTCGGGAGAGLSPR